MSDLELIDAVAKKTGESLREILTCQHVRR